jgi:hypothetical protein
MMSDVTNLVISGDTGTYFNLTVHRRTYSDAMDIWDGNWLGCTVVGKAGPFGYSIGCDLRAEAFEQFRDQLERIVKASGVEIYYATFSSMEPWVDIRVTSTGSGRYDVGLELRSPLRSPHELRTGFVLTRDGVTGMYEQVRILCQRYPAFTTR